MNHFSVLRSNAWTYKEPMNRYALSFQSNIGRAEFSPITGRRVGTLGSSFQTPDARSRYLKGYTLDCHVKRYDAHHIFSIRSSVYHLRLRKYTDGRSKSKKNAHIVLWAECHLPVPTEASPIHLELEAQAWSIYFGQ